MKDLHAFLSQIGVRLISLINQGDSVLVKMAFRVRTELEERKKEAPPREADREPAPMPMVNIAPPSETPRAAEEKRPFPEPARTTPAPRRSSKAIASAETDEKLLNFHPYTAISMVIFNIKWSDTDLPFRDIRVRR